MTKSSKSQSRSTSKKRKKSAFLDQINIDAAGIDVGSAEHFVAVPQDRDKEPVRRFEAFTADLYRLADWLKECGIKTVAMESTGVYWIPLFQVLEQRGFEVKLVNAKQAKNVSGRKSDMLDCQWLQQLHTYGLLNGAFRPENDICVLRAYLRHRENLIRMCTVHIQHIQKAMAQMNILLDKVISNIVGQTGLRIIRAILVGERDALKLANLKDYRIKNSANQIAKSLEGDYREEHLFALGHAVELYDFYHLKIEECDRRILAHMQKFQPKINLDQNPLPPSKSSHKKPQRNEPTVDWRPSLYLMTGVDLTRVPGINTSTAQTLISEIGLDISRWPTEKQFASWLSLSPNARISGGKVLNSSPRKFINRASQALRLAANSLKNSKSALGAFFRRIRSRSGPQKAVAATAHKLARLIYRLLKFGHEYVEVGERYYEQKFQQRSIKNLEKRAKSLGYALVPFQQLTGAVS
jgi:transposase